MMFCLSLSVSDSFNLPWLLVLVNVTVLTYVFIDANIPAGTTLRSVAHSLLRQLFMINSGSVANYQVLRDALKSSRLITDPNEYDTLLWDTLESVFETSRLRGSKDVVLIVDGTDEASCDELTLLQKLASVTSKAPYVRIIFFGTQKLLGAEVQTSLEITNNTTNDISTAVKSTLQSSKSSTELSDLEKLTISNTITESSNGSFLWARLAAKCADMEAEPEGLCKAVDRLVSAKPTIFDMVSMTLQNVGPSMDAKQMLLWLATAERPLYVRELLALASVSIDKHTVSERNDDILLTLKPFTSIIFLEDGLVCFRHGTIRHAVLDLYSQGKLLPVSDRHTDLATRLLIYIKCCITQQSEPSFVPLSLHETDLFLARYPLLDFALRYWPFHFRNSTVFQNSGAVSASKEFAKVLPTSTTFVRLQSVIWDSFLIAVSTGYQELMADIYREAIGVNNMVTIQCIVSSAVMYRQLNKHDKAIPLFYQAAIGSSNLLTTGHVLTSEMASAFLSLTEDKISSAKTDTMIKRGECLQLSVECCKTHDGAESEKHNVALRKLNEHYQILGDEQ